MTTSLSYLAWTIVLAVVQIFIAAAAKRQQDGMQWATGNRDGNGPEYTGLAGRMARAQSNLYETLPLFIGAVLLAHVVGRDTSLTAWGAGLYFWARLIYIPTYGLGLVPWRSVVWAVGVVGLLLVMISLA